MTYLKRYKDVLIPQKVVYFLVLLSVLILALLAIFLLPSSYLPSGLLAILRLLVPLLMLKRPLLGIIASIFMDAIDHESITLLGRALEPNSPMNYVFYQQQDKVLDSYMCAIAAYTSLSWKEPLAQKTSVALFFYRFIGVIIFLITQFRPIFVLFPNVIELFYLYYVYMLSKNPNYTIGSKKKLLIILIVLSAIKLTQEYTVHVLDSKPIVYIRYSVLKAPW
ncbi:MAG TPA: hypothetical protein VEA37_12080 [Flavobacterium sp.]|nr:hypothetical protein [Flavobacterium sp.]